MGEGNSFSLLVCPQGGEVPTPNQVRMGGGGTPKYLPPGQGTYLPRPGQDGEGEGLPLGTYLQPRYLPPSQVRMGEGTSRHLPPWPRYLPPSQVRMGQAVPHGTYSHPAKVLTSRPGQDGGGGTPRYLPPPQPRYLPPPTKVPTPRPPPPPAKDLLHGGQYASCVHAGGL